ncbi:unnamed protein product [Mucor hiemalis]
MVGTFFSSAPAISVRFKGILKSIVFDNVIAHLSYSNFILSQDCNIYFFFFFLAHSGKRTFASMSGIYVVTGENRYKQGMESYNAEDYDSALPFFSHAAYGFEHQEAKKMLGAMYRYGQGTSVDTQQAILWYKRAGDASALYNVGLIYFEGAGDLERNTKEAMQYFQRAADGGSTDAEFFIGKMYQLGDGVALDSKQAFHWFFKAANNGHVEAKYQVGLYYEDGAIKDKELAFIWFKEAAEGGHEAAQLKLGNWYSDTMDYANAFYWLKQAATNNDEAMLLIGEMYLNGSGVACDENEALRWFQKAYTHSGTDKALDYISQVKKQKFNTSQQVPLKIVVEQSETAELKTEPLHKPDSNPPSLQFFHL